MKKVEMDIFMLMTAAAGEKYYFGARCINIVIEIRSRLRLDRKTRLRYYVNV